MMESERLQEGLEYIRLSAEIILPNHFGPSGLDPNAHIPQTLNLHAMLLSN